MKAKHQSNIELLRIFSKLLIIGHHLAIMVLQIDFNPYSKKRKN